MSQELEAEGLQPSTDEDFSLEYGEAVEEPENGHNITEERQAEPQPEPQEAEQSPVEEPPAEAEPQLTDVETLQKQLNEAMGIISQFEQQRLAQPTTQEPAKQVQPEQTMQATPAGQIPKLDFLQGVEDHVEILQDREKLNNVLCQVAVVAYNAAVQSAQEQIMRRIPTIVQSAAQQQSSLAEMTREFYTNNPDLSNFKQAVSMAAMQVYNENPKLTLPEILSGAAQRTREVLRLAKPQKSVRKPAQPAGGSIRSAGGNRPPSGQPQMSEQERQIAELLTF